MSCMHNSGAAAGLYLLPLNAKVKLFAGSTEDFQSGVSPLHY